MIDESIQMILDDAEEQMTKAMAHFRTELSHIRAGRANPAMLEGIRVDYYGSMSPIGQVSSITAPTPDMIIVQPWETSLIPEIEKAIMKANLGINPSNDGIIVRIPIPPLSQERRTELAKSAKGRSEEAKISVRNTRRSSKDEVKKMQQEEHLPEDMRFEAEEILQKMTNLFVSKVDTALDTKTKEIMEV